MFNKKSIDELVRHLIEAVPSSVHETKQDLERNFRAILQDALSKMDLVTREEFDAQVGVLHRTREKIVELEKKVIELEDNKRD